MAKIKVYPHTRVKPESAYLRQYRANVTSQYGEDGIIAKIFEIMGSGRHWCVEFGAWDGRHFSNSWALLNQQGWHGVLIEGEPRRCEELSRLYADNPRVKVINQYVGVLDDQQSLDQILAVTPVPQDFDLLSVDIDGCDWHVWQSVSNYRPRLVVIEFNVSIPNNIYFVQDRNPQVNQGSSLRALIELGKEKGYELVATTSGNAFFVRGEDFALFGIADNSIDAMHSLEGHESFFFQLMDGTVVLLGCTHLLWHRLPINQEDIQVLPRALRRWQG